MSLPDCPVYRAEDAAARACPTLSLLIQPEAIPAFVAHVTTRQPFLGMRRAAWPELNNEHVGVVHTDKRESALGIAHPKLQMIELAPGPQAQYVLLHEIAHLCCPEDEHHGRMFADVYLRLVREWLGEFAAVALLRELRRHEIL